MSEPAVQSRVKSRSQKHRRSWLRRILVTLAVIIVLIPVFGYAALKGWVPEPVVTAVARAFIGRQPDARPWDSHQPANVLILGLQIGGVSTNPLTDSLMVASYQPSTDAVGLLSIPRDLYVELPGHGQGRINEAFEDGGAQEALLTVQQNLGIPVNYYALVSYTAFEKLIDDVGGVTVEVDRDIDDPTFPAADEIHYEPFHITKGSHHLDGHEALRYARTRHADSDFGRAARQQQVLMALKDQMKKPANWFKLPLILHDARATVRTNFPFDQAVAVGLRVLRAAHMKQMVLGNGNQAVSGFTTSGGASVQAPNKKVIQEIVEQLFGPSLEMMRAGGTIRVDNGNGYAGAATQFGNVLTGMGAKVMPPGDADRTDYSKSTVRVYSSSQPIVQKAKLIAGMLGTTVESGSGKGPADIQVILGRDYAPFVRFTEKDWEDAIAPR